LPLAALLCGLTWGALGSNAHAHSIPVLLKVQAKGSNLEMQMFSQEGLPIIEAQVAYTLTDAKGRVIRQAFTGQGLGLYTAPQPKVTTGTYTFLVRDTTFKEEAVEVKAKVNWPLTAPLSMVLPASKAGSPNALAVILFLGAPVLLSGAVLAIVVLTQKKRGPGEVSPEKVSPES
jgi:hypothetical protein